MEKLSKQLILSHFFCTISTKRFQKYEAINLFLQKIQPAVIIDAIAMRIIQIYHNKHFHIYSKLKGVISYVFHCGTVMRLAIHDGFCDKVLLVEDNFEIFIEKECTCCGLKDVFILSRGQVSNGCITSHSTTPMGATQEDFNSMAVNCI